jgi:methylphosphotriester-DNA--protein-cysteine methyltransferase
MYPADDILVRVRLATEQARALKASIEIHLARARALQVHVRSCRRANVARDAGLAGEVRELARTSRRLVEDAREHRRHSRLLVEQARSHSECHERERD